MANSIRVTLEIGPKGKRVAAVAPDWPGLERGARTGEAAIERLLSYVPRYATVAKLAGMEAAFARISGVDVVEQYPGTGSTDFWGISFAFSSIDRQPVSYQELERELALMQACWAFFDDVRSRVSAEMQRGPRGGGRDRDRIVRHTLANELDWAKGLGLPASALTPEDTLLAARHWTRIAMPTATQSAPCIPKAKWPATGRFGTSSGTLPTIPSITPGKWKIKI